MTIFVVPESVHAAPDHDGNLVLLNQVTGHWHLLNRTGRELFEALRAADIDSAIAELTGRHPGVPAERIRADARDLVSGLVRRGLLEPSRQAAGVPMAVAPDRPVSVRQRAAALMAFPLAILLLRLPFRVSTKVLAWVKRRFATREATRADALGVLAAARRVSRHHPGRVACLELTLTAALAAALQGGRVAWCLGFAVDPRSFHAWLEVGGQPVAELADDPIPPTYQRVFTV